MVRQSDLSQDTQVQDSLLSRGPATVQEEVVLVPAPDALQTLATGGHTGDLVCRVGLCV